MGERVVRENRADSDHRQGLTAEKQDRRLFGQVGPVRGFLFRSRYRLVGLANPLFGLLEKLAGLVRMTQPAWIIARKSQSRRGARRPCGLDRSRSRASSRRPTRKRTAATSRSLLATHRVDRSDTWIKPGRSATASAARLHA